MTDKSRQQMLEDGIRFGPFKTEHHRLTVDAAFKAAFLTFVMEQILPKVTIQFGQVDGHLRSGHDDERFFGPNSCVKFRYGFKCYFILGDEREEAKGTVDYDPDTKSFVGRTEVDTLAAQAAELKQRGQILEILERIEERGEENINCPECGKPLSIWKVDFGSGKPFVKDIGCPTKGCIRVHFD